MIEPLRNSHLVLVVEDHADAAAEIKLLLRAEGLECLVATTLAQAEALLDQHRFCLVLLDLALPVDDPNEEVGPDSGFPGFALLRRIRGKLRLSEDELPVIVMTAYPKGFVNCDLAYRNGANAYLGKPLQIANPEPPQNTILACLKKTCEAQHATCPRTGKAKNEGAVVERPVPRKKGREYASKHRVHLHGGKVVTQRRHRAEVNSSPVELTASALQILHSLEVRDRDDGDGFLGNEELGLENAKNAVNLLKTQLEELGLGNLIQTVKGRHRLTCPPENVTYNDAVMRAAFDWFKPKPSASPDADSLM